MNDAVIEKKQKTGPFQQGSLDKKRCESKMSSTKTSSDETDRDDETTLGVVTWDSDKETVTKRDDPEGKSSTEDEEIVQTSKNPPWSSLLCDEKLDTYDDVKGEVESMDCSGQGELTKKVQNETKAAKAEIRKQEPRPTIQMTDLRPLVEARERAPSAGSIPGDFEDAFPPTSFLLRQNSLFSQNGFFQGLSNEYSTATLFNSSDPTDFNIEELKPPTPYTLKNGRESIIEQVTHHQRPGEWHGHQFETMNNGIYESRQPSDDPLFAFNLAGARRVVQTPHGPAILVSSPCAANNNAQQQQLSSTMMPHVTTSTNNDNRKFKRWSEEEDDVLKYAMSKEGPPPYNWKRIAHKYFSNTRSSVQCKSRWTKSLQPGVVRGSWQKHEDDVIVEMRSKGMKWSAIAELLPGRIGEHVRDRYVNFLDPTLKRTPWTAEEDKILFREQRRIGNKWTEIAKLLPGRSENSVKNRWHNAKMTQRRQLRKQANERSRIEQNQRARQHCNSSSDSYDDDSNETATSDTTVAVGGSAADIEKSPSSDGVVSL